MAKYKISGVWVNGEGIITHYAVHTVGTNSTSRASKMPKAAAVQLLQNSQNEAYTWLWNYTNPGWIEGARVVVVAGTYLRTVHDGKTIDNLAHLIDYDWIAP